MKLKAGKDNNKMSYTKTIETTVTTQTETNGLAYNRAPTFMQRKNTKEYTKQEKEQLKTVSKNKQFTNSLVRRANLGGCTYEESSDSDEKDSMTNISRTSRASSVKGKFMYLTLNMGSHGLKELTCLSKDDPEVVAKKWCKENKFGKKTCESIIPYIKKKQD